MVQRLISLNSHFAAPYSKLYFGVREKLHHAAQQYQMLAMPLLRGFWVQRIEPVRYLGNQGTRTQKSNLTN